MWAKHENIEKKTNTRQMRLYNYNPAWNYHPKISGVDLNLGCPQPIARKGNYGAWLLRETDLICDIVRSWRKLFDTYNFYFVLSILSVN